MRIELRGGLNLLDLNVHSEHFYARLLNLLFSWDLINANVVDPNCEGIDLVSTVHKVVVQVSATATKRKIDSALSKDLSKYAGYAFKFVSICRSAKNLRSNSYSNPHGLTFVPSTDIHDVPSILTVITAMDVGKISSIQAFLASELAADTNPAKTESNLAAVMNTLSKIDWNSVPKAPETNPYDIDAKITANALDSSQSLIRSFSAYYSRLDQIYTAFDEQGANKSLSILNGINSVYLRLCEIHSGDKLFRKIAEEVKALVAKSANYVTIPDDELLLCVQILVVDAFVRCKIFKNPTMAQ